MSDPAKNNAAITPELVNKTAGLARISIAPEDVGRLAEEINTIVGYMDILNRVDTSAVEPLYSPMLHVAAPRADVALKELSADEILANAPKRQGTFFVVPPTL